MRINPSLAHNPFSSRASSSHSSCSSSHGSIACGSLIPKSRQSVESWTRWVGRIYANLLGTKTDCLFLVDFVPYYSVGNICIASKLFLDKLCICYQLTDSSAWMVFWNAERLDISNIFVVINSLTQLYYVFAKLGPMNTNSTTSTLTHIVSKTFAGIGVLDLLHNGSVAYFKNQPATTTVRVLTGLGFGLASASSDWILGGCLVYDLVALAAGQQGSWRTLLGAYAVGSAAIVGAKNLAR